MPQNPQMARRGRRLLDGRLKLRHLTLVDALSEQGSVVAAASALHISQPVATRALHELEDILEVKLYERGARGVIPTDFGVAFTDHARHVLAQLRMAGRHLDELGDGASGAVVIGNHLAGASSLLPRAILNLKAQSPGITVVVREGSPEKLAIDLEAGRLDFVVGRLNSLATEGLEQQILYEDVVKLVVGRHHPLAEREDLTLEDLTDQMWIMPVVETHLRGELERVLARHMYDGMPTDRIETTLFPTVRRLLVESEAVAALPSQLVVDEPLLKTLPIELEGVGTTVGLTSIRGRRLSPTAERMQIHLLSVGAELGGISIPGK